MIGLTTTPASSASLLLNLEGVLTALLAWFAFRENFDRRIFLGMVAIVGGGLLLSWNPCKVTGFSWEALAIVGACFCWAIDNSLTCFVLALRDLGTARTSAYFATAPFIGVVLSLLLLREIPPLLFLACAFVNDFWGMDAFDRAPRARSFT